MMEDATAADKALRGFALSPDGRLMAAAGFAFDSAGRRIIHRVWIRDVKAIGQCAAIEVPAVDLYQRRLLARRGDPGHGRIRRRWSSSGMSPAVIASPAEDSATEPVTVDRLRA